VHRQQLQTFVRSLTPLLRRRLTRNRTTEEIRDDLTEGKGLPKWILSSYGPGKNPPASLLQTNEYSPEELRVRFYELANQGKQDAADEEAVGLWSKAIQDINNVKNNADEARKFIDAAGRTIPNRYTAMKDNKQLETPTPSGTFGSQTSTTFNPSGRPAASAFGQQSSSSAFSSNQTTNNRPFGTSSQPKSGSFGQIGSGNGFGSGGGFGQAGLGKPAVNSGFSQPAFGSSGFGAQTQNNTFGQAAASNVFGSNVTQSTSTFGQLSSAGSPFGQAAPNPAFVKPSTVPAFGQSSFGQPNQPTSTFGQPSQPTSTFGQPGQPTGTFGQPRQPTGTIGQASQRTSTFGQSTQPASTFGQTSQPSNQGAFGTGMFGGSSGNSSIFGKPAASSDNPFGVKPAPTFGSGPGVFGGSIGNAASNPFGVKAASPLSKEADMGDSSASRPQSRDNPFSMPPPPPKSSATTTQNQFGAAPGASSVTPRVSRENAPKKVPITYAQTLPDVPSTYDNFGKLSTFRGQPVIYIDDPQQAAEKKRADEKARAKGEDEDFQSDQYPCLRRPDGELERIWFPKGNREENVDALRKLDLEAPEDEYTDEVRCHAESASDERLG
jgi:nucleoporin NUP42